MGLQMGGIDHDALRLWSFARQGREDTVKDTEPAPSDEAIIEGLVRPIVLGRIFPLQAVLIT